MALLETLGLPESPDDPPRVSVGIVDEDRARVASLLEEAWPESVQQRAKARAARSRRAAGVRAATGGPGRSYRFEPATDPADGDRLHAGRFGEESPLLAVHLGAGTAAKRWPVGHWRALVGRFLRDGWRVVVVGGPDDAGLAPELPEHPMLRDWTGLLSVVETAALLERADLFLGADSGPAHLAACAGVPSVILFSGTNRKAQWRPWSRRSLVLSRRTNCRPCHHKTCPLADHPCLSGLAPERVYRSARAWWARQGREHPTPSSHR